MNESIESLLKDYQTLKEAVRLMRAAQGKYFKTRDSDDLKAAKAHEARVDYLVREPEPTNQIDLF